MTREEAINTLKAVKVSLKIYPKRKKQKESVTALSEAIDMAISALHEADKREQYRQNYEADDFVKLGVTDKNKYKVILYDALGEKEYYPQTEPSGDLISKAEAIEAVCDLYRVASLFSGGSDRREDWYEKAEKLLSKCPSADAVQGEWEHWGSPFSDESEVVDTIVCSVCGARFIEPKDEPKWEYNYCPNCGARMKGGA